MYNSSEIADKIRELSKDKGVSVRQMLLDVGLGANTLSHFQTSFPKVDNIAKIADYLGCSIDYLMGRDNIKNAALPDESDNAAREERIYDLLEDLLVRAGVMQPGSDITPAQLEILVSVSRILFAAFSKEEG